MSNITTTSQKTNSLANLLNRAKIQAKKNQGKLIFGFDATASREPTWAVAQELQASMFAAVRNLDVQLAVFRGVELLISPWEDDPSKLKDLMSQIHCVGGNTQISRLLQHILDAGKAQTINAFVFIGDTFEEQGASPQILAQAKALGDLKVPGFLFLEGEGSFWGQSAETMYKEIAKLTNGAFAKFDASATKTLEDLLASVAAFASGGLAALSNRDSAASRLLIAQMKK